MNHRNPKGERKRKGRKKIWRRERKKGEIGGERWKVEKRGRKEKVDVKGGGR